MMPKEQEKAAVGPYEIMLQQLNAQMSPRSIALLQERVVALFGTDRGGRPVAGVHGSFFRQHK